MRRIPPAPRRRGAALAGERPRRDAGGSPRAGAGLGTPPVLLPGSAGAAPAPPGSPERARRSAVCGEGGEAGLRDLL